MAVKNKQLSDAALEPFLATSFDPAEYLNQTLPPLQISSKAQSSASLSSLSAETQTLLATLNAQATRLTNALTQMTDDIVRTGSRLAYQVDVLRSESSTLSETLTERLQSDIQVFAPSSTHTEAMSPATAEVPQADELFIHKLCLNEPPELSRLRLLVHVKDRLDSVIRVFGAAIAWPAPPASSSSFISVAAPPSNDTERKAKEFAQTKRSEIVELLNSDKDEAARAKVEELRQLLDVWNGTAESKSREKFIAELMSLVENGPSGRGVTEEDDSQAYLSGMYT